MHLLRFQRASERYLYSSQCITGCPSGTYANATNVCVSCSLPCEECAGSATACTKCNQNAAEKYLLTTASTCYANCPSGYYNDGIAQQCATCISPCQTCTNSTYCLTCLQSQAYKYYWQGVCSTVCPNTTILTNGDCQSCTSPCQTCAGASTACTSCINSPQHYLHNSACISSCPAKYIVSPTTGELL